MPYEIIRQDITKIDYLHSSIIDITNHVSPRKCAVADNLNGCWNIYCLDKIALKESLFSDGYYGFWKLCCNIATFYTFLKNDSLTTNALSPIPVTVNPSNILGTNKSPLIYLDPDECFFQLYSVITAVPLPLIS